MACRLAAGDRCGHQAPSSEMDGGSARIADPRRHDAHPLKHGGGRAGKRRDPRRAQCRATWVVVGAADSTCSPDPTGFAAGVRSLERSR